MEVQADSHQERRHDAQRNVSTSLREFKYSGGSVTERVKILNGRRHSVFEWFGTKWMPFCSEFEWFGTKWPPFCSDFEWSEPFENLILKRILYVY